MELTDLTVLVAVAETGSMSAASRRLHLALAAVSARVRGLEEALGATLLVREPRGVRLTPAGELAVQRARSALDTLDQLRAELSGQGEVRGRVRLRASTMAVAEHLPPVIGRLLAQHPALEVEVEERPSLRVLEALEDGRADVGMVSGVRIPQGWVDLLYRRDRLVLLVPSRHRLAAASDVTLAEVADQPFVGLDEDSGIQRYVEGLAERGGRRLHIVVRVRSFDAIGQLVSYGAGVAVVPASTARRLAPPGAAAVQLSDPWAVRELRVCAPKRPFRSAPVEVTLAALRETAEG